MSREIIEVSQMHCIILNRTPFLFPWLGTLVVFSSRFPFLTFVANL